MGERATEDAAENKLMDRPSGLGDRPFLGLGSAPRGSEEEAPLGEVTGDRKEEVAELVTSGRKWDKGQPEDTKYTERRRGGP